MLNASANAILVSPAKASLARTMSTITAAKNSADPAPSRGRTE